MDLIRFIFVLDFQVSVGQSQLIQMSYFSLTFSLCSGVAFIQFSPLPPDPIFVSPLLQLSVHAYQPLKLISVQKLTFESKECVCYFSFYPVKVVTLFLSENIG